MPLQHPVPNGMSSQRGRVGPPTGRTESWGILKVPYLTLETGAGCCCLRVTSIPHTLELLSSAPSQTLSHFSAALSQAQKLSPTRGPDNSASAVEKGKGPCKSGTKPVPLQISFFRERRKEAPQHIKAQHAPTTHPKTPAPRPPSPPLTRPSRIKNP